MCVCVCVTFSSITPVQRVEPTGECPAPPTVNPAPSEHLAAAPPPPQPPTPVKVKSQPKVIPSVRNDPIGLNVSDFLPVSPNLINAESPERRPVSIRHGGLSSFDIEACVVVCQLLPSNRGGALSDAEALSQITKGHDTMCVMLSSRRKNLETVRSVWAREDIKVSSVFRAQRPMRAQPRY